MILAAGISAIGLPAVAYPVTVRSCDRELTFDAPPRRAASNDVNLTEMMLALGLAERMAGYTGVSSWTLLDPSLRAGVPQLSELSSRYPSRDVLQAAELDFWFAGWNYGLRDGGEITPEGLAPLGIEVYELSESCIHIMPRDRVAIDDLFTDIRNLATIFGVPERAEALIQGWQAELAGIVAARPTGQTPPRVFVYDSGEDAPFTAARYAMPTALIELAGGRNIMDDVETSWTRVAWGPVIERDPQIIVIVDYGDPTAEEKIDFLRRTPALSQLEAVRSNRFVILDYVEATPGPRNIAAVRKLAAAFAKD